MMQKNFIHKSVLLGNVNTADWLEPICKDYPKYGPRGATQLIPSSQIKLNDLVNRGGN